MNTTSLKLSKTTIFLHWFIACTMIGMIIFGKYIDINKAYQYMSTHKSIGIIVFVFVVWRLVLRLTSGFPKPVAETSSLQKAVANLVHWVLLIGTVAFPLSGMIMSAMGGRGLQVFGLELFAMNIVDGKPSPLNPDMASMANAIHTSIGPIMLAAIALHIIGALYHHFVVKDATLKRMLGCTK